MQVGGAVSPSPKHQIYLPAIDALVNGMGKGIVISVFSNLEVPLPHYNIDPPTTMMCAFLLEFGPAGPTLQTALTDHPAIHPKRGQWSMVLP